MIKPSNNELSAVGTPDNALRWTKLGSRMLQKTVIFDLCVQQMRTPDGVREDDYYYLDIPDCTNTIAITPDQDVVLISQYRHGINDLSLELPGGLVNKDELDLSGAALRELEEETGYRGDSIETLGWNHPNPPILNSRCHSFLVANAKPSAEQNLDHGEYIRIELHPLKNIPQLILENRITHSNMIATFFQFFALHGKRFGLESWVK